MPKLKRERKKEKKKHKETKGKVTELQLTKSNSSWENTAASKKDQGTNDF